MTTAGLKHATAESTCAPAPEPLAVLVACAASAFARNARWSSLFPPPHSTRQKTEMPRWPGPDIPK